MVQLGNFKTTRKWAVLERNALALGRQLRQSAVKYLDTNYTCRVYIRRKEGPEQARLQKILGVK